MSSKTLYQEGKLDEAVEAALADVRKFPTDTSLRSFLCELLCIAGDFERADKQLDVIAKQEAKAAVGVGVWRGLIRAAVARRQFYQEGRVPEFLSDPDESVQLALKATIECRAGNLEKAKAFADESAEKRGPVSGKCDGIDFADFFDWDDLTYGVFELFTTSGKFFWIPFQQFVSIEFHELSGPRDLIWRPARVTVNNGPDGEVYFPVLYDGSEKCSDNDIRLSRITDWNDESGVSRGVGVRMFMVGGENKQILQMNQLSFMR